MDTRYNDRICFKCERQGKLLPCSGGCLHAFHQECLGLSSPPAGRWTCPDCARGSHACFQCKGRASDHELIRCTYPDCRRYFHPTEACCGKDARTVIPSSYVCPSHRCAYCGKAGDSRHPLLKCFRCVKSYHPSCLPQDVIMLDPKYFLCASHRNETAQMPPGNSYVNRMQSPQQASPFPPYQGSPYGGYPPYPAPAMNSPYGSYPMPMPRPNPVMNEPPVKKPKVSQQIELTLEQKAGKSLLSNWRDLRRAGIELKQERIEERARLLQDIKGKAKIQQLNTQKQKEKMGL